MMKFTIRQFHMYGTDLYTLSTVYFIPHGSDIVSIRNFHPVNRIMGHLGRSLLKLKNYINFKRKP